MIQRPKLGETEEDLLKQQEEFLKAYGRSPSDKKKVRDKNDKFTNEFNILKDVTEKKSAGYTSNFDGNSGYGKGFPNTFLIDSSSVPKKKGKSLFALHMEQNKKLAGESEEMQLDDTRVLSHPEASEHTNVEGVSTDISALKQTVHEENYKKLSQMPESEILEEQKRLLSMLNPDLITFLKNRGSNKNSNKKIKLEVEESKMKINNSENSHECEADIKSKLEQFMDSRWINMDFIEKEKLEWIGDLPDKKSLEPNQPYSARFDFKGELQPFSSDIDVRNALYHHGEEPERPGYTIQELYQLSRSQVLQQRILALNTLAFIIRKTKLGYYDKCFDGQLLHKLVEADLVFLLRFSLDEAALVPASIHCLHSLLNNESDEFCLDKLMGATHWDEQPLLINKAEPNKDEENELKDHVILSYDMIKGLLRTDILLRLSYILSNCSPNRETISRIINCLIRISRHSPEAATEILQTNNLMKMVYLNIRSNAPFFEGVKLFRVTAAHSREIAVQIIQNYNVRFFLSYLESDENASITKKEFYLLKLEIVYLWKTLMIQNLFVDEFSCWSPNLIRLLLFYVQKVDVGDGNDFDFELFSSLTSLIVVCNRNKISSDPNIIVMLRICLEKWLTQLIRHKQFNFSVSKAVGCVLRYFSTHYKFLGVTKADLDFVVKINSLLGDFFKSVTFTEMASALSECSYILSPSTVTRDPENLPSLCSVYDGGETLLKIVQNNCSLPFFLSLAKYLKTAHGILNETMLNINLFLNCPEIRKFVDNASLVGSRISYNWFMKYEVMFLSDILQLHVKSKSSNILELSFGLLPLFRVDDENSKTVFGIIFDGKNLEAEELPNGLASLYRETLLRDRTANYKNDLVPVDWMFRILSLMRGKDAVADVRNILRFIGIVLDKNLRPLSDVCHALRYYYSCHVFLNDSNVFDEDIQKELGKIFRDVVANREKVNLCLKLEEKKSFYDLYTELITQYAGVSYGLAIFAQFVLFPLQNGQNVSFRKLLWFEYLHVLRVIVLPYPMDDFVNIKAFIEPPETDESLLVTYLNSISNGVITKLRNPFLYHVAVGNIKNFLSSRNQDERLFDFMKSRVSELRNAQVKSDILNFTL